MDFRKLNLETAKEVIGKARELLFVSWPVESGSP